MLTPQRPVPQSLLRLARTKLSIPVGPSGATEIELASPVETLGCTGVVVIWRIFEMSEDATAEVGFESVPAQGDLTRYREVLTIDGASPRTDRVLCHTMSHPIPSAVRVSLSATGPTAGSIEIDMALEVVGRPRVDFALEGA